MPNYSAEKGGETVKLVATKLRNANITKVDLVDEGANQGAAIKLYKAKAATKTEDGEEYPAAAFAYVPDPKKPSTWKLRLWDDLERKETPAQVARAIQAISPSGFRGNRVQIPAKDMPKVKAKILAAWRKTHPDASEDEIPAILRKGVDGESMNWLEKIAKAFVDASEAVNAAINESKIQKEAITFNRAKQQTKISSLFDRNWWDYTSALRKSIESILNDEDLEDDEKEEKITQSLEEFSTAVIALLFDTDFQEEVEKASRKIAAERLARMKEAHQTLAAIIAEVESENNDDEQGVGKTRQPKTKKEEIDTMKIDKSKMTPEERELLEALEKKYGTNDDDPQNSAGTGAGTGTETGVGTGNTQQPEGGAGIAKSLAEANVIIEKLVKRLDEVEEKTEKAELLQIAKKYEVCGEKPEELVNTLYALKKSGNQAAYDAMIATLDKALSLVEKSGLFREIGKSGQGGGTGDAWDQIVAKAQEIRKSKPELTEAQAIDLACQQHPELVADYEQNR